MKEDYTRITKYISAKYTRKCCCVGGKIQLLLLVRVNEMFDEYDTVMWVRKGHELTHLSHSNERLDARLMKQRKQKRCSKTCGKSLCERKPCFFTDKWSWINHFTVVLVSEGKRASCESKAEWWKEITRDVLCVMKRITVPGNEPWTL